jgi:hypothetical protein
MQLNPAGSPIDTDIQQSGRVLLALSDSPGGGFALYAEVITAGHLTNLYRSTDAGTTTTPNWAPVANAQDPFLGGQGNAHGAILADPNSAQVVYVSGDAIPNSPATGVLYQVNATAGTWMPLSLSKSSLGPSLTRDIPDNLTTTLYVVAASAYPVNSVIQVDNELMQVTARDTTANTLMVTRGFNNSTAAPHGMSSQVVLTTTLTQNVDDSSTILNVAYAANITKDSIIQVDNELMQVTMVDPAANTLTVTRGFNGTTKDSHFAVDFRGNPRPVILITNGASNTTPHADSKVMVFHNGNILEADDGGLYELTGLSTPTPTWVSRMGDPQAPLPSPLQITQFVSAALDPVHKSILGGSQDNGSEFLVNGTSPNQTWNEAQGGDGALVAVDQTGVWHYTSSQRLGGFQRFQLTTDAVTGNNTLGNAATTLAAAADNATNTLTVAAASAFLKGDTILIDSEQMFVNAVNPGNTLTVFRSWNQTTPAAHNMGATVTLLTHRLQLNVKPGDDALNPQFITQWALNAAASAQANLVIGTNRLYESTDRGDNLTELRDATGNPVRFDSRVSALAYGGVNADGTDNPGVLYVGESNGNLWLRTTGVGTGTFNDITANTAVPGRPRTPVQAIAVDPTNWQVAVVVKPGKVWLTTNAGAPGSWTDITGNLTGDLNDTDLLSAQIVNINGTRVILVGGSGGLYRTLAVNGANTRWNQYGQNLPNVPISQVRYYGGATDTLLVATFGRGTWTLANASATLTVPGELDVTNENTTALRLDPNNPLLLDVFRGKGGDTSGTPDNIYKLSSISKIVVTGTGVNDALVIDSSNGGITASGGISFTGTGNNSQLGFEGQTFTGTETLPAVPFANGSIISNGTTVAYTDTQALDDLNVAPAFVFNVAAGAQQINVAAGQSIFPQVTTQVNSGASQAFLAVNFANKTTATINGVDSSKTFTLNNPTQAAAGLNSLQVNGTPVAYYLFNRDANGFLTRSPTPLMATGLNASAPAGSFTVSDPVATFTNADPLGSAASYSATIDWGDGSTSAGLLDDSGGGTVTVRGTHTYAASGRYQVTVKISHNLGYTMPATTLSDAVVGAMAVPVTPPPLTVTLPLTGDVTDKVTTVIQVVGRRRGRPVTMLILTLFGTSGRVIQGPITVIFNGLKPTVKLLGATGVLGPPKRPRPFVVLTPVGNLFQPGAELSVPLRFRGQPVRFTTTLLAGPGAV